MATTKENVGDGSGNGNGEGSRSVARFSLRDGLLFNLDDIGDFDRMCIRSGDTEGTNSTNDSLEIELSLPKLPANDEDEQQEDGNHGKGEEEDSGIIGEPTCLKSLYGGASSFDEKELAHLIGPDEDGGLVWMIKLVKEETPIKPRRGMPFPVSTEDFLSSVKRIGTPLVELQADAGYNDLWDSTSRHVNEGEDQKHEHARWVFKGILNGWPGLTLMEVRKVCVNEKDTFALMKKMMRTAGGSSGKAKKIWDADDDGNERGVDMSDAILEYEKKGSANKKAEIVVELRAPAWTSHGWSATSPGFVFWVEGECTQSDKDKDELSSPPSLTVTYGTDLIDKFAPSNSSNEEGDPVCTRVHMINHRYASPKKPESPKDKLTYHSFIFLEWDHGNYCSVVEIGYLNGLGGYKGKSNWFHDKDATPHNRLYAAVPPELVLPWKSTLSEIRITNVPFSTKEDFVSNYMNKYEGHAGRFVDINCSFSNEVRLTYNTRSNIATYLLNYIRRNRTYSEMRRNCQTFAADLCGFLAGKRNVSPYHPVNQIQYHNSSHYFLYESSKYSKDYL